MWITWEVCKFPQGCPGVDDDGANDILYIVSGQKNPMRKHLTDILVAEYREYLQPVLVVVSVFHNTPPCGWICELVID